MNPKISVVTVCYNAVAGIERTILSVINQTYKNIEYIVIDGGSTDGTLEIIEKYRDRIDYFVSEPDNGIYDAMNKGIKAATGEWINFMNAGDEFYSHEVITHIFHDSYDTMVGIIWGDAFLSKDKIALKLFKNTPFYTAIFPFRAGKGICHQSMFFKSILCKSLLYNLDYPISADFDLSYRIYLMEYKLIHVNEIVSLYDISGYSSQNRIKAVEESGKILSCSNSFIFKIYFMLVKFKNMI